MALPVNIDDLINHRKVEWARIEYKEGWNPEKILHTLCAFANDIDNWGGGYIIIGIAEENGRPVFPIKGIEPNEVDVIQKELLNVCHLIEPVYLPVVEPCVYEGKCLLIVWAPGGCERPYRCPERIAKDVKSPKAYYIRKLASTVKATRQDEKELFELTGDVPYFRKMEDPISERTALKTALTSQMGTNKDKGEECVRLADSGRIVGVMTAEEELEHIKVALKTALKTALIRRPAKVIERMGLLLQQLLRDKDITIVALASLLGASRRTVQEDIAILKNLKVLDRVGPDNGGEWVVLLKW
jgi:predicted HTH transcriptional regulator